MLSCVTLSCEIWLRRTCAPVNAVEAVDRKTTSIASCTNHVFELGHSATYRLDGCDLNNLSKRDMHSQVRRINPGASRRVGGGLCGGERNKQQ